LLIQRFNSLLDDIYADKDASLLSVLKTGLTDEHTVADLIDDLKNGSFSSYITVSGESLATVIEEIRYDIQSLYQQMSPYGITYSATRDGAHQSPRAEASEEGTDE
jgi:hypothetical protein